MMKQDPLLTAVAHVIKEKQAATRVGLNFAQADVERLTQEVRDLRDRVRELEDMAIAEGKAIRHTYAGRETIIKAL